MIVRSGFDPSDITAERRTAARALCVVFKRPLQHPPTRSNVSRRSSDRVGRDFSVELFNSTNFTIVFAFGRWVDKFHSFGLREIYRRLEEMKPTNESSKVVEGMTLRACFSSWQSSF